MFGFVKIYVVAISLIYWSEADILEDDDIVNVRLVGDTKGTGRLEVLSNGQWYAVENDGDLSQNDAIVVCRMLGFNDSGLVNIIPNMFGYGGNAQIGNGFNCDGSENSLKECSSPTNWYTNNGNRYRHTALSCEASKVRLVDGDDSMSGRVEIFILNNWYTVCDDEFDYYDAYVICHMLGFTQSGVSRSFSGGHYGQGYGGVFLSKLRCSGSERDLKACSAQWGTNQNYCDHRRDAGVSCNNTHIRLVDGPTNTSGRVEILHAGMWGTICSGGGFTNLDVKVICNTVGVHNPNAFGYSFAFYGQGHGNMMLSNLVCDGSESDIAQCSTTEWTKPTSNLCQNHAGDVGVNCEGKTPIRLKDGDTEQSGRVEFYNLGQWGSLSDNNFDRYDLEVICRMLGYTYSSKSFYITGGYYGQGTGRVLVSNLNCNGGESDIGHCSATWWPNTGSLSHSNDVGISCDGHIPIKLVSDDNDPAGRVEISHDGYYHTVCGIKFDRADLMVICRMLGIDNIPRSAYWRYNPIYNQGIGEIGASHIDCDGTEYSIALCRAYMPAVYSQSSGCDHSYDISVNCKGGPEHLRLVGGNTNHSGTVEINVAGSWATICDTGFDRFDAIVICRVLGFQRPERAIAYSDAHFGQGNVSIVFSNLQCNGVETNVGQCDPSLNTYGCDHSDDIGVDCCPNCNIGGQIIG